VFFRYVCRHFLASGTGNAANPVSVVRATDVMVNNVDIKLEVSLFDIGIIQSLSLPDFRN
ncbi:hypothetical protein, partial [Serratia ureilytica]|uniref:hypothetical protein n=1 Tax=Serratia ureilytica TaxID=300181 RepID=UPI003F7D961F